MGKRVQILYGKLRVSLLCSLEWIPRPCVESFGKPLYYHKHMANRTQQGFSLFNNWVTPKYSLFNTRKFEEISRRKIIPNKGNNEGDVDEIAL